LETVLWKCPSTAVFFVNEEAAALREGNVQFLPFRDRSGRRIMILLPKIMTYSPKLRCKLWMYYYYICTEDVETQRNGMVAIAWGGTDQDLKELKMPAKSERIMHSSGRSFDSGMPIRVVAIHVCNADSAFYRLVRSFYVLVMPYSFLARIIFHHGAKVEMRYILMGYGIPVAHIPDTDTGAVKLKNHLQWLKMRKLIESDPANHANICECPGVNDVLFRRAGSCTAHPGNSLFKNLIESKKEEHKSSNQTEKRDISWSIVEEIERRKGRFFKWNTDYTCWTQIMDRAEIRLKVAMSIRDFNRQSRAAENRQSTKSSTKAFQRDDERKRKRTNQDECNSCL